MTEISLVSKKGKVLTEKQTKPFMEFWEAFNYKNDRANAIDAWLALKVSPALHDKIVDAARRTAQNRPSRSECEKNGTTPIYAQGWLSGRRFEDEQAPETTPNQQPPSTGMSIPEQIKEEENEMTKYPERFASKEEIKGLCKRVIVGLPNFDLDPGETQ